MEVINISAFSEINRYSNIIPGIVPFGGGTGAAQCVFGAGAPFNGQVAYSTGSTTGPWPSGTVATLICTSGLPTGTTSATCTNGAFSPLLGTCNPISSGLPVITPPLITPPLIPPVITPSALFPQTAVLNCAFGVLAPPGGTVTYSLGGPSGPFTPGTLALLSCPQGTPQGNTAATCTGGVFTPPLGTCSTTGVSPGFPSLSAVSTIPGQAFGTTTDCVLSPPAPLFGTFTYSSGSPFGPWRSGVTATLTCSSGSVLQGSSSTLTCSNGQWTGTAPTCVMNG